MTTKTATHPNHNTTPQQERRIKKQALGQAKHYLQGVKLYMDKKLQEKTEAPTDKREHIPPQYYIYKKLFADELEIGLPEHTE